MKQKIFHNQNQTPEYKYNCTELELHTYVDGELGNLERANVLKAAQQSAAIRAKLNELELLKQLVQHSYKDIFTH